MYIFSSLKNKTRITRIFSSFALGIVVLSPLTGKAQEDSTEHKPRFTKDIFFEDYSDKIHINPFVFNVDNGFELRGKTSIRYKPNQAVGLGLRFTHRWLSLAIAYEPKAVQEERYGATNHLNLMLSTYGKRIGVDLYYLKYKGYYISNPQNTPELAPNYRNSFPIYPDLSTLNLGFNVCYIFNHRKYSYRSTFLHNDIQRKSAGSVILTASYSYYRIHSDTGVVPQELFTYFPEDSRITNGSFHSMSIMPGYSYTLVGLQRLFVTFAPSVGPMLQFQTYSVANSPVEQTRTDVVPRAMLKAGFGFNSRKFFIGYSGIIDSYIVRLTRDQDLNYFINNSQVYLGIRIGVPKAFEKTSAFIDKYDPRRLLFKQNPQAQ